MKRTWFAVGLLFATAAVPMKAQTSLGAILGNVKDPTGAFMRSVHIGVRNENTGFVRSTITDDVGFYLVDRIDADPYTVTAEAAGFKSVERRHVELAAAGQVRVDITMEVGNLTDKVTVEAASPVIETETARIATVMPRMNQLMNSTNNFGPFNLMMMAPAVFFTGAGYSANGSRATDEWLTIGGIYIGSASNGVQNSSLGLRDETTQEVLVSSVNNPAEYGSTTVMNQVPVSGTNRFHGDVQYRNTNSALAARTFFAVLKPVSKTVEYLGSLGGPVLLPHYNGRNKTFFFFSMDRQIMPNFASNLLNVPTQLMRQGDFSRVGVAVKDPTTGSPFPGGQIPANRLNAAAQAYLNRFYPPPNAGNGALPVADFTDNVQNGGRSNEYTLRVDQSLGSRNTLTYSMFKHFDGNAKVDDNLPAQYLGIPLNANFTQSHGLSDTFTLSPTKVNEFRAGFGRKNSPAASTLNGQQIVNLVGLNGYPAPISSASTGIPAVTISGLQGINTTQQNVSINNWWDINDNFTFVHGRHAFKTGASYFWTLVSGRPASPSAQFGSFAFDGFATGQPFADFLLGVPHTASWASEVSPYYGRRQSLALYFQDDWKVLPNVTLNLGIRYEVAPPYKEQNDRIVSFDPKSGKLLVPNQHTVSLFNPLFPTSVPIVTAAAAGAADRSLIATDGINFAPRVGLAWRTGLMGLVVRSGYGIFYDTVGRNPFTGLTAGPFTATSTFDNTITNGAPLFAWPRAFPQNGSANPLAVQDINAASATLPDAYTQQWSLSLDKQIGANGLRLSYIGSESVGLLFRRNLNQPLAGTTTFQQSFRPVPVFTQHHLCGFRRQPELPVPAGAVCPASYAGRNDGRFVSPGPRTFPTSRTATLWAP